MSFRPLPARTPALLLREARPLKALFKQAQHLARLQALVEAQLQPAAREHCRVASLREGTLLLIISDANWATRLRYQQRRLQQSLAPLPEFAGLMRIAFKVSPATGSPSRPRQTPTLSPGAAASLNGAAEGITDPRLRAALQRLANNARRD